QPAHHHVATTGDGDRVPGHRRDGARRAQGAVAVSSSSEGAGTVDGTRLAAAGRPDAGAVTDADGLGVGGAVGAGLGVAGGITEPSGAYHTSTLMGLDQLPATSRHCTRIER